MEHDDWIYALTLAIENSVIPGLPVNLREYLVEEYVDQCVDSAINDNIARVLAEVFQCGIRGCDEFSDDELLDYFTTWNYCPPKIESLIKKNYSSIDVVKITGYYMRKEGKFSDRH